MLGRVLGWASLFAGVFAAVYVADSPMLWGAFALTCGGAAYLGWKRIKQAARVGGADGTDRDLPPHVQRALGPRKQ